MQTFDEALKEGFTPVTHNDPSDDPLGYQEAARVAGMDIDKQSWHFDWDDGENHYELWFEKLLWDDQYYVAVYKNQELLTNKVVVKPGYAKDIIEDETSVIL